LFSSEVEVAQIQ